MATFPSNLYELLHVPSDSSFQEIRRAYRRRALDCHPDKQPIAEDATACSPEKPNFVIIAAAATLLLDPFRRRQYDQLLFLNKLTSGGRVSNADEVVFGLDGQGAGEFCVIGEAEEDCGSDEGSEPLSFRWCGLECRCGGWYRVSVPTEFFRKNGDDSLAHELRDLSELEPSVIFRTVHVECESCSLTIAVEKVPTHGDLTVCGQRLDQRDVALGKYMDLFLGLDSS